MKVHLHCQPRKTVSKGTVNYYSLASCYRDGGKNKKQILLRIGRLTDEQAEVYRNFLKNFTDPAKLVVGLKLDDVSVVDEKSYLDVLVVHELWNDLQLNGIFSSERRWNEKLSTEDVAKILTINKVLSSTSKVRTIQWFSKTLLNEIMKIDAASYSRPKIFSELSNIHSRKDKLERHLAALAKKMRPDGGSNIVEIFYFDGTTSWFEGGKCELAQADLEKTRGYFPDVIALMMVTDVNGFPIAWEALDGHTKDVSALKSFVKRIKKEFDVKQITYCFDRGVASIANFKMITGEQDKFISGIRDNQIDKVLDLAKFELTKPKLLQIITRNLESQKAAEPLRRLPTDGFYPYDQCSFFRDLGVVEGQRYIASFNKVFADKELAGRERRIIETYKKISAMNEDLENAKKARDFSTVERELIGIFTKQKTRNFFSYTLQPTTSNNETHSFRIESSLDKSAIAQAARTDGMMVYVTSHTEKNTLGAFKVSARDIVAHYRGKYVIEGLFRELKSAIELRPFFVWKTEHVKAHYDITVLAAFINHYICRKLGQQHAEDHDFILPTDFYAELAAHSKVVTLSDATGRQIRKRQQCSEKMKQALARLGLERLSLPGPHTSYNVYC
jgi:hypothetical protein